VEFARLSEEIGKVQLENMRKKTAFDIVGILYEDLYKFGENNKYVIRKLGRAAEERKATGKVSKGNKIEEDENLETYLNSFESIYEQRKREIIRCGGHRRGRVGRL